MTHEQIVQSIQNICNQLEVLNADLNFRELLDGMSLPDNITLVDIVMGLYAIESNLIKN